MFLLLALILLHPIDGVAKKVESEHDRQTIFNDITDSLATAGKSVEDAQRIKKLRKHKRRKNRIIDERKREQIEAIERAAELQKK
jgi:hypothetical protein